MARSENARAADVKLIRTIRLDPSDTFVFDNAAEPGEWAVSGAFVFWNTDPAKLEGKARSAFRGGFLGVESLGWSTLVQIVEASEADRAAVVETLAQHLLGHFGAPKILAARAAARRGSRVRGVALRPSGRHADRGASQFRGRRGARGIPHPASARRAQSRCERFRFIEVEGEEEPADEISLVAILRQEAEPTPK